MLKNTYLFDHPNYWQYQFKVKRVLHIHCVILSSLKNNVPFTFQILMPLINIKMKLLAVITKVLKKLSR